MKLEYSVSIHIITGLDIKIITTQSSLAISLLPHTAKSKGIEGSEKNTKVHIACCQYLQNAALSATVNNHKKLETISGTLLKKFNFF